MARDRQPVRRVTASRDHVPLARILRPGLIEQDYEIAALEALGARSARPVLGFDIADPSDRTPAHILAAMTAALSRPDATHYTRIRGLPAFVEGVADLYARFGVEVDPYDQVLATTSSQEGLFIAFFALMVPGAEFIVPNPTFPAYPSLLQLLGGRARFVASRPDFHLDVDAIERAVTKATRAIVLCTPNNPTGAVYHRDELAAVLQLAERHALVVISDESYNQIVYDGREHCTIASLPGALERTIVVSGLSKVYAMTGWRLGYVIARADLIAQLEKVAYEIRGSVNTAVQHAGRAALAHERRQDRTTRANLRSKAAPHGRRAQGRGPDVPHARRRLRSPGRSAARIRRRRRLCPVPGREGRRARQAGLVLRARRHASRAARVLPRREPHSAGGRAHRGRARREEASVNKTQVNPWTWQDAFGFSQAWTVEGARTLVIVSGQASISAAG